MGTHSGVSFLFTQLFYCDCMETLNSLVDKLADKSLIVCSILTGRTSFINVKPFLLAFLFSLFFVLVYSVLMHYLCNWQHIVLYLSNACFFCFLCPNFSLLRWTNWESYLVWVIKKQKLSHLMLLQKYIRNDFQRPFRMVI